MKKKLKNKVKKYVVLNGAAQIFQNKMSSVIIPSIRYRKHIIVKKLLEIMDSYRTLPQIKKIYN